MRWRGRAGSLGSSRRPASGNCLRSRGLLFSFRAALSSDVQSELGGGLEDVAGQEATEAQRKMLAEEGSATIFNLLGPLLNPARPEFQLAGVFDGKLLPLYAEAFKLLGRKSGWAVHGSGGLDEVSTLGPSEIHALEDGAIRQFIIRPEDLDVAPARIDDLRGGEAQENAEFLEAILLGKDVGPRRDMVVLNAACSLVVSRRAPDLPAAMTMAASALDDGSAHDVLQRLRKAG